MCSPDHRARPDGWDASIRIGVLTPHGDVGPESELQAMAPAGVVIHAARVPFGAMGDNGAMVLGARRVALFAPPWFDRKLVDLGRAYYESAGLRVPHAASCGLPSDQRAITPDAPRVGERAAALNVDAVVIGGNGFRAVGVIAALEARLGLPVVTANQALLWAALRAAGADTHLVTGYGRLLARSTHGQQAAA